MGTHERRRGGDAADRALPAAADRLLLRTVWRGGHWAALLAVTSIAGAVADTVLPAAAGHTVDVILQAAERPGTAASAAGRTGHWLAGCIALIILIVICEAAGQFAIGMSTAGATAWLRLRLSSHVFACGLRLPRRFPAGDLVGRVTGGAADASYAAAGGVPAVAAVIPPVGSIVALALIDPWLAVAFAAGLPGLAIALRVFVRDASDVAVRYQRAPGRDYRPPARRAGRRAHDSRSRHLRPGGSPGARPARRGALARPRLLADPGPGRGAEFAHRPAAAGRGARRRRGRAGRSPDQPG